VWPRPATPAIAVGELQANDLSHAINHQDRLERALRQQIVRERRSLETGLAVVASIGSTSPFIGLFGTVASWKRSRASARPAGQPGNRGRPIGAALVATGVGIAVAVPAVLVYNYFLRRLKLTAADLDDFAHDFYSLAEESSACWCTRCCTSPGRFTQPVKEAS
jgi:biopolymer transport protein ExbB